MGFWKLLLDLPYLPLLNRPLPVHVTVFPTGQSALLFAKPKEVNMCVCVFVLRLHFSGAFKAKQKERRHVVGSHSFTQDHMGCCVLSRIWTSTMVVVLLVSLEQQPQGGSALAHVDTSIPKELKGQQWCKGLVPQAFSFLGFGLKGVRCPTQFKGKVPHDLNHSFSEGQNNIFNVFCAPVGK